MKRGLIIIVVAALLAGAICAGFTLRPEAVEAMQPGPQAPQAPPCPADYELVTLLEDVTLNPGEMTASEWIDAKPYRLFKVYAYLTTDGTYTTPLTGARVFDTPFDTFGPCDGIEMGSWNQSPPEQYSHWSKTLAFEGLYSEICVHAHNFGSPAPETISAYLLMAKE